jgi:hypothetical protein
MIDYIYYKIVVVKYCKRIFLHIPFLISKRGFVNGDRGVSQ